MKVLVCSLDSAGFLFPAIGLARALAARGHAVAFVTDVGAAPLLFAAGCERLARGNRDGRSFETEHWFQPLGVALQVRHIEHAVDRFSPDLLIGQALTLGPLIVRERSGLPLVVQGLATPLWPGTGGAPPSPATAQRRTWRYHEMLGHLERAREVAKLPPRRGDPSDGAGDVLSLGENPFFGDLFLLRSVAELHGGHGLPERLRLVGACLWEPGEPDAALDDWLTRVRATGTPLAYVQPGRTFGHRGFWNTLYAGFAAGPIAVAGSTGRLDASDGAPTAGVAISTGTSGWDGTGGGFFRPHLDQDTILRNADLMIGSATTTAVLGALRHGVPSLLLPSGGEQLDLAEIVEAAGAARVLSVETLTPDELRRAALEVLTDSTLRRRAERLRDAFAQIDGFARSVDLIEWQASRPAARVSAAKQDALGSA